MFVKRRERRGEGDSSLISKDAKGKPCNRNLACAVFNVGQDFRKKGIVCISRDFSVTTAVNHNNPRRCNDAC